MAPSLLCVHAHPDDEVLFTGGVLAQAAAAQWTTTVVTCTDGRYGYAPGGVSYGTDAHDPEATAALRSGDLRAACAALGVDTVVELGYPDSGMRGWPINRAPEAFVNQPLEVVAAQVAAVIDAAQADLVVTYDRFGVYGHPDHIKATEVTEAALALLDAPPRLLQVTVSKSAIAALSAGLSTEDEGLPQWLADLAEFGSSDEELVAMVNVTDVLETKRRALECHGSQLDNRFFLDMDAETFALLLGSEVFTQPGGGSGEIARQLT